MKKYLFLAAFILAALTTHAQQDANTAADAVRFSVDNITGTARFRAMGGAFGAVGGDLSSININPAGAAIFAYNTGTATVSSYNVSNKANYFGTTTRKNDNAFDLNQLGAIFVFNNNREGATMNKFTLGFNFENTNSYDNTIFARGVNPNNSVDKYFLRYANGVGQEGPISLSTLENGDYSNLSYLDQQAYLGYNAYAFNPVTDDDGNTTYRSNVPATGTHYQESNIATTGYNGKVALNFAGQFKKWLYLGGNVNVHFANYINNTRFYEQTTNTVSSGALQQLQFNNEKYTYGGGISFNLGAIAKVTEKFRLGLAYESPTWLRLQDETTQSITGVTSAGSFTTNPGVTMVSDDYTIKTPAKYTGSFAYIFGKSALLSVDYAMRNYGNTEFKNYRYNSLNTELSNTLDWAGELRVGAEYRIKAFSLRGGYRYQQSPYKNTNTMGDLMGYSGGLGFAFGGSRLDLAYTWYQRKSNTSLLNNSAYVDAARVTSTNNNITLSYTLDL